MSLEIDSVSQNSEDGFKGALVSDLSALPRYRKIIILMLCCCALFLDAFNSSSIFTALPVLSQQLHIPDNQSVWLFAAYQLSFAAFLLLCGRVTDLYNPKWIFLLGSISMTIFSIVAGFLRSEIPLIIFRALIGAAAALTIPSSQHLIVHMYPDPKAQANALALFGGMAGFGLVFGLFIGAAFVEFVSWHWTFYFGAIVFGTISVCMLLFVPNLRRTRKEETRAEKLRRFKRLDLPGVFAITAGLILFIFAVTSGSSPGWGSAQVIAPLVLSVILIIGFFIWEARIPEEDAALPPKIWKYENTTMLIIVSFMPFMWWGSIYPLFAWYWELVYNWSPIKVALHFLVIGLGIFPLVPLTVILQAKLRTKWLLLIGLFVTIIADILLTFDNSPGRYWRFGFPGFLLGTCASALLYGGTNITLLANTPPEISGVISALFMAVAQTGAAAGLAIVTSIENNVEAHHGGPSEFKGRAAGLWFLVAMSAVMAIFVLIFMKDTPPKAPAKLTDTDKNVSESKVVDEQA